MLDKWKGIQMKPTITLYTLLSLIACLAHAQPPTPVTEADWGLKIVVFNVGQADAALVLTPNGDAALIDLGKKNDHGTLIANYLLDPTQNGVARIDEVDFLFISHYDQDHIGGAKKINHSDVKILQAFDQGPSTKRFNGPNFTQPKTWYKKYTTLVGDPNGNAQQDTNESNFVRETATPGLSVNLGTNATIQVLAVNGDTAGTAHDLPELILTGNAIDENPGSLIMLVSLGEFDYLTTGDASSNDWKSEPDTEEAIINANAIPGGHDIDVLKVAHHGSDTSSGEVFVTSTDPEIAIIPSKLGQHGLPKLTSIKILEQSGAQVLVTGKATSDAGEFKQSNHTFDDGYQPQRTLDQCGNITILVAPDGSKYSVYLENIPGEIFTNNS